MSFLTGTQFECISAQSAAGTALSNSTAATVISHPSGAALIPAGFFSQSYGLGRTLKVMARGIVTDTATGTPTLTVGVYANTTQGTVSANNVGSTGAITESTIGTTSNVFWEFEADIVCQAVGSSGKFVTMGQFMVAHVATGETAPTFAQIGSSSQVTLSTEVAYWLELVGTWGTAESAATITCEQFFVYGVN